MKLKYFKQNAHVRSPFKATAGAAAYDISANLGDRTIGMLPGGKFKFPTGLHFEVPEGYWLMIASRSGLATDKNLVVINQPGVIDSDYRGEVFVTLMYLSEGLEFSEVLARTISHGDRIAQAILIPKPDIDIEEVGTLDELTVTARGHSGHGATGR